MELSARMKRYESCFQSNLMIKQPVIIRIDGKSFHQFCKRFEPFFDTGYHMAFNKMILSLCKEIQGVKIATHHSDEASLLLGDFETVDTQSYFDYNLNKMNSVVSSLATSFFTKNLLILDPGKGGLTLDDESWPCFDCRCFNIPLHEVSNYFYWRLKDALRNSVMSLGQRHFSHKELMGKNISNVQDMLHEHHKINWNFLPQEQKTGFRFYKEEVEGQDEKRRWVFSANCYNKKELDEFIDKYYLSLLNP
jgi:tRNA(His) guanylyltransferase